jgi:hypothetical protein
VARTCWSLREPSPAYYPGTYLVDGIPVTNVPTCKLDSERYRYGIGNMVRLKFTVRSRFKRFYLQTTFYIIAYLRMYRCKVLLTFKNVFS